MFKVIWKDVDSVVYERDFDNLAPAMEWAKVINRFVTIKGNGMEIVGLFGADSVKDGLCPDGVEYDWKKRRK
jgi:hypothetical protein